MNMDFLIPDTLFLAAIAFFSYAAQSISGFGSTVVAVTLGAHFFPLPVLIPSLVFLEMLLNGYLKYRYAGIGKKATTCLTHTEPIRSDHATIKIQVNFTAPASCEFDWFRDTKVSWQFLSLNYL